MRKALAILTCLILFALALGGVSRLLAYFPQQEVGRYEFHNLPHNWASILSARQNTLPNPIECKTAALPENVPTARVALDCTSINYSGKSRGIAVDLTPLFGMFAAVSDMRVMPRVTPWPSFNAFADYWGRMFPLLLLLSFHNWKDDLRRSTVPVRITPLLVVGAGVGLNVLGRWRDWIVHGRFLRSAEAEGILVLEPILLGPIVEELLFRGVMYRWLEKARFGTAAIAIVTSLLFTLWHGHQITWEWRAPELFVTGLVLFYVRHRTGSITAAIFAHMIANGLDYL